MWTDLGVSLYDLDLSYARHYETCQSRNTRTRWD